MALGSDLIHCPDSPKGQTENTSDSPLPFRSVCIFLPALAGGGAERMMLKLASSFAGRGVAVDLVVTSVRGPLVDEVPQDVRVVDLRAHRIAAALLPLASYLRRERPDVLLSALSPTNCVALLARKMSGAKVPIVVSERNTISRVSREISRWQQRIMPTLMQLLYASADHVIAISRGVADDLIQTINISRAMVSVIYNPAFSQDVLTKAREEVDDPWFHDSERPVIIGVGRLTKQKDFGTLIRAFSLVRRQLPARLVILGEGEERSALSALVDSLSLRDDVKLSGYVKNPYKYVARSKAFVLSSRWEGFGNVLVEAMALGVPIVSTDCPHGPREILEEGRWGRLVPVGATELLAQGILDGLDGMLPVGEERAKQFSVEAASAQYIEVLRHAVMSGQTAS